MENIIKKIKAGKLCRCNDESGSKGFWDLAGELQYDYDEETQEVIYNSLWKLVDCFKINKCKDCK